MLAGSGSARAGRDSTSLTLLADALGVSASVRIEHTPDQGREDGAVIERAMGGAETRSQRERMQESVEAHHKPGF